MMLSDDDTVKWGRIQARLRATVGQDAYDSWFTSLKLEDIRTTVLYCSVPTFFLKRWIEKHYAKDVVACTALEYPEIGKVFLLQRKTGIPLLIPDQDGSPDHKAIQEEESSAQPEPPEGQRNARSDYNLSLEGGLQTTEAAESEHSPPSPALPTLCLDRRIFISQIIQYACTRYKLAHAQMLSGKRNRDVVRPRQIGMFLSKYMTDRSLPEIGRKFGGRDHTTVLHSIRRVEERILEDIEFAFEVASLEAAIRHRTLA